MRILLVGATGTIGGAVTAALAAHDLVAVGHRHGAHRVDLADPASIRALYAAVGAVDAVVCAAGRAAFRPLQALTDADFDLSLRNKLMGQVNLVRIGLDFVRDRGSFTLSSGSLARQPAPGSAAISLVNAGLEAFVRAAALEMPRGMRVNVVSPGWVSETLAAMGRDPAEGTPAAIVARSYAESVEGDANGRVFEPSGED